jgi:phosphoadenosine phosphosulfate reductase
MGLLTAAFAANPDVLEANLADANAELADCAAAAILAWALARARNPVISTNFRPGSAVLLHMVVQARPDIPVIWVDTGYNTPATYRYAEALRRAWQLHLHCYTPRISAARRQAVNGGIPQPDAADFMRFTRDAKLEPFERALNELAPDIWFTGIRATQNEFRAGLGAVSRGPRNTLRVAPSHRWSDGEISAYLERHGIPDNDDYVDPTKPGPNLECGLQRLA